MTVRAPRKSVISGPQAFSRVRGAPKSLTELCLNAWFPDAEGKPLVVRRKTKLCVNLGPRREASASSESDALPAKELEEMLEVDHVDVMVLAADADVERPLRQRLDMPPDPARVLTWKITPRREGRLDIHVVLLVNNAPVHRMHLPIDVVAAGEAARARGVTP